jgi:hypothetical protein
VVLLHNFRHVLAIVDAYMINFLETIPMHFIWHNRALNGVVFSRNPQNAGQFGSCDTICL